MSHYIAMNRFRIVKGQEKDFEEIWETRTTYLEEEPGFLKFNLLKGPERDDHVLYASHTLWENQKHFETGPSPRRLEKPIPEPATADIFILDTLNSKDSKWSTGQPLAS